MAVLAADNTGNIYAFTHYTDLWSLRLADVHSIKVENVNFCFQFNVK